MFFVVCRDDDKPDGSQGDYKLATSRVFASYPIANHYAQGISIWREAIVLKGNAPSKSVTAEERSV